MSQLNDSWLISKCLVLSLKVGFEKMDIAVWLSQYTKAGVVKGMSKSARSWMSLTITSDNDKGTIFDLNWRTWHYGLFLSIQEICKT